MLGHADGAVKTVQSTALVGLLFAKEERLKLILNSDCLFNRAVAKPIC